MMISVDLTDEQLATISGLEEEACELIHKVSDGAINIQNLVQIKKLCEEFLAYPIVQAISLEGLD
jgi:hypothetical protein